MARWQARPSDYNICDECDDDAIKDIAEVLETLACHWRRVWKRPSLEMSDFLGIMLRARGPHRETQTCPKVSGAELEKEARKQTDTAASIDGWSGDKVASFSSVLWDRIAMFSRIVRGWDQHQNSLGPRFLKNAWELKLVMGLFMLRPCGRSYSPCCGESGGVLNQ